LIEELPTEILEIIVVQSLEANLPRASLEIAKAVSHERIYRIFMVQAFWNDPVRYLNTLHTEDTTQCSYYRCTLPVDYQELSLWEQRRLQASIAHCRWLTSRRLLDLFPVLYNCTYHAVIGKPVSIMAKQLVPWAERMGTYTSIISPAEVDYMLAVRRKGLRKVPAVRIFLFPACILQGPWNEVATRLLLQYYINIVGWRMRLSDSDDPRLVRPFLDRAVCIRAIRRALTERQTYPYYLWVKILAALDLASIGPFRFRTEPIFPSALFRSAAAEYWRDWKLLSLLIQTSPVSAPRRVSIRRNALVGHAQKAEANDQILRFLLSELEPGLFRRPQYLAKKIRMWLANVIERREHEKLSTQFHLFRKPFLCRSQRRGSGTAQAERRIRLPAEDRQASGPLFPCSL
jgi:hypothetical protein